MKEQKREQSIAVIGAGIIGINCALSLQNEGYQVTLIDDKGVGEACSKGNAGHFATEQVFPLAEASILWQLPKLLLDPLGPISLSAKYFPKALPWFAKFMLNMLKSKQQLNSEALKTLNENAINYYKPWLKEADAEHLLTEKGSLLVFETASMKEVKKQYNHYKNAGVAVLLLDKKQTLALESNLHQNVSASLYFTDVGHTISPYDLSKTLANLAFKKGCTFKQDKVTKITQLEAQVALSTANDQLIFDDVVVACGAWSKSLLKPLGYSLPIEAERGYSLDLYHHDLEDFNKSKLTRPVASAERKFIITPMSHGLRFAGTVEYAGLKQKANMARADMLYQNAQATLANLPSNPSINLPEQQKWMGHRPSLPDSLPVISKAPNHTNIYFALGHQHLGLTQGALTGKLINQLISNQTLDLDLTPFCISRFN